MSIIIIDSTIDTACTNYRQNFTCSLNKERPDGSQYFFHCTLCNHLCCCYILHKRLNGNKAETTFAHEFASISDKLSPNVIVRFPFQLCFVYNTRIRSNTCYVTPLPFNTIQCHRRKLNVEMMTDMHKFLLIFSHQTKESTIVTLHLPWRFPWRLFSTLPRCYISLCFPWRFLRGTGLGIMLPVTHSMTAFP